MSHVSSDALKCPVCFDWFDTPSTLPCGHVLCLKCARLKGQEAHARTARAVVVLDGVEKDAAEHNASSVATEAWDTFLCPVCGTSCPFDLSSVSMRLPLNGDVQLAIEKARTPHFHCHTQCGSMHAVVHCVECTADFCEVCASEVHSNEEFKTHKLEVNDVNSFQATREMVNEPLCPEHKEPLTLCCLKDEVAVCAQCLQIGEHRNKVGENWAPHKTTSIKDMVERVSMKITGQLRRCESHREALDGAHEAVSETARRLHNSYTAAKKKVGVYFEDLITRLHLLREEKLKELDQLYEREHGLYELQVGVLGSARAYLKETISTARRVLEEGSVDGVELLQRARSVVSRLEKGSSLCRDQLTASSLTHLRFTAIDWEKIKDQTACGFLFRFNASTVTNRASLNVSVDGLTVRHSGPQGWQSVHGSILPNRGRHTWRLRLSGGNVQGNSYFSWVVCGVSTTYTAPPKCYGWYTDGSYCCGDGRTHADVDKFFHFIPSVTPEAELTLDSDEHTLTMRRLDNGNTQTINNIPQNVYVYVRMLYPGNSVTIL